MVRVAPAQDPVGDFALSHLFGDWIDLLYFLVASGFVVGVYVAPYLIIRRLAADGAGAKRRVLWALIASGVVMVLLHVATAPVRYSWELGWRGDITKRELVARSLDQSGLATYVLTRYDGPDRADEISWTQPGTLLNRWVDGFLYQRIIVDSVPSIDAKDDATGVLGAIALVLGIIPIIIKTLGWILVWTPLMKVLSVLSPGIVLILAGVDGLRKRDAGYGYATVLVFLVLLVSFHHCMTAPTPGDRPGTTSSSNTVRAPSPGVPPPPQQPPIDASPSTACGDPASDPGVGEWTSYACSNVPDPRCKPRKAYTSDRLRGCPGAQLCCPPRLEQEPTAERGRPGAERPARDTPNEASPLEAPASAGAGTSEHAVRIDSSCSSSGLAGAGTTLLQGWCFYSPSIQLEADFEVTFTMRAVSGDGYGVWVGSWRDGRVAAAGLQYDLGANGLKPVRYPDTESASGPIERVPLDRAHHTWVIRRTADRLTMLLDERIVSDTSSPPGSRFGFRTWRGKVELTNLVVK